MESVIIGLLGHVDHGKTTLTKALTGKWSDTYKEELLRGISIKLGYADMGIYKCGKSYWNKEKCPDGKKGKLVRIVSFLDAPGHESLMATAVAASSVIDGALFLIAANEPCPQEQTKEHLMILELMGVKNIVVVQTKIDLVSKEQAIKNYREIKDFLKGTVAEDAPIVPVSATYGANIDELLKAMYEVLVPKERDVKGEPLFYVLRSFDVNKPGTPVEKLVGGVLGGVVARGTFKKGDKVHIVPGFLDSEKGTFKDIETEISSIRSYAGEEKEGKPGMTLALGTYLDPALTKGDRMAGSVVVPAGSKIGAITKINVKYELVNREDVENRPFKEHEVLLLNVGPATTAGVISSFKKGVITVSLKKPVADIPGQKVAIQRRIGHRWRLAGVGELISS